jgi:hypothetical protein
MSLRNGFFVNSKRMVYALTEGSPYEIEQGRLEPRRKPAIAGIKAELARLQEEHPLEANLRSARYLRSAR